MISFDKNDKSRQWELILYPENMVDNWQDLIAELFQVPICWIIHDQDNFKLEVDEKQRKIHVHLWILWNNTTTLSNVINIANKLSKPNCKCCSTGSAVHCPEMAFKYMTHSDPQSIKKGKHRYSDDELHCDNNFDIGSIVEVSTSDKINIMNDLSDLIKEYRIMDIAQLHSFIVSEFGERSDFMIVFFSSYNYFDKICAGVFKQEEREIKRQERINAKK